MTVTTSPDLTALYTAVRAFVRSVVPAGTEVIQGLGNRAPPPLSPFVAMTALYQIRLTTNQDEFDDPNIVPLDGTQASDASMRVDVQLDFYGPDSLKWATGVQTLWRDDVGCTALAPTCQPLYAEDPRMIPLVTGEEQYEQRWNLTATLQYNPVTVTLMEFADTLSVDLINVDETYPP